MNGRFVVLLLAGVIVDDASAGGRLWTFTDVAASAGLAYEHGFLPSEPLHEAHLMSGGIAVGDVDRDGFIDLYMVRGTIGPNLLLRNRGDGSFEERGQAAGVALAGHRLNAPSFFDLDGDGWLDLVLGGIEGEPPRVFMNRGDFTFSDQSSTAGLVSTRETWSSAAADYDQDGDLDLVFGHWSRGPVIGVPSTHLWRNDGPRGGPLSFSPVDFAAGIAAPYTQLDFSFTPNFADLDQDGLQDLLIVGDFGSTEIFRNLGGGLFGRTTDESVIMDENGMGAALGDFDGDLDLDFFVTSIWDPDGLPEGNWGTTGNRLYRNLGNGRFADATDSAGVRQGFWGWGSCAGDFDNDGDLDLFHTNGFQAQPAVEFHTDPDRLFLNDGFGVFSESSAEHGLVSDGQGRGVFCFDLERDGDLDLLVSQNGGPLVLYRNDGPPNTPRNGRSWFALRLIDRTSANSEGIGARVVLEAGGRRQMRRISGGSNYLSQNPAEAFFGLGSETTIERLEIIWPDGEVEVRTALFVNQVLTVERGQPAVEVPTMTPGGRWLLLALLAWTACLRLLHRPM